MQANSYRCPICLVNHPLTVRGICPDCNEACRPHHEPPEYAGGEPTPKQLREPTLQERIRRRKAKRAQEAKDDATVAQFLSDLDRWNAGELSDIDRFYGMPE